MHAVRADHVALLNLARRQQLLAERLCSTFGAALASSHVRAMDCVIQHLVNTQLMVVILWALRYRQQNTIASLPSCVRAAAPCLAGSPPWC